MRSVYSLLVLCLASVMVVAIADPANQVPLKPDKKVPVKMNCYMDPGATVVQCECTPCKTDPDEKKPPSSDGDDKKTPPSSDGDDKKTPPSSDGDDKKTPPSSDGDDKKKTPSSDGDDKKKPPSSDGDDKKTPPSNGGDDKKKPPSDSGDDPGKKKKCPSCPDDSGDDGGDSDPKKKCPGGKCPPDGDDCTGVKCPPGCISPTKCPAAATVTVTATKTITVNVPGGTGGAKADDCPDSAWPLRRMWNAAWQDHYYETDARLMEYANTLGFVEQYPVGRVFLSQIADTVPLWRCLWRADLDHLYTADEAEFRAAQAKGCEAFPEPGSIGFLYKTQKCNSLPLYRVYNEQKKDHLYTSDVAERDNLIKSEGYKDEGITGYVLPNWGMGGPKA